MEEKQLLRWGVGLFNTLSAAAACTHRYPLTLLPCLLLPPDQSQQPLDIVTHGATWDLIAGYFHIQPRFSSFLTPTPLLTHTLVLWSCFCLYVPIFHHNWVLSNFEVGRWVLLIVYSEHTKLFPPNYNYFAQDSGVPILLHKAEWPWATYFIWAFITCPL